MARSKYQIGRPTQEVRLRNWPAGRVAQFKKAIELLEIQLNQAMATQVDQGDKRVFNTRVPKVTGLTVRSGFKNFQIHFLEARGISNLLFYEIQKSNTENFAVVTTYQIPQTDLTIATATEREIVFFRVRCVTSNFEVGPWSSTGRGVGSSNFRIAITRTAAEEVPIAASTIGTWVDVTSVNFEATASNVCLHVHAGIHPTAISKFPSRVAGVDRSHQVEVGLAIRLLKNGVVMTSTGTMTTASVASVDRVQSPLTYLQNEQAVVETIVTPFEEFAGTEGTVTYTIQAQILGCSFGFVSPAGTIETLTDDVGVVVDVIDIMEIIAG